MPFPSVTETELDLGITYAHATFGRLPSRDFLRATADRLTVLRHGDGMRFKDALDRVP